MNLPHCSHRVYIMLALMFFIGICFGSQLAPLRRSGLTRATLTSFLIAFGVTFGFPTDVGVPFLVVKALSVIVAVAFAVMNARLLVRRRKPSRR